MSQYNQTPKIKNASSLELSQKVLENTSWNGKMIANPQENINNYMEEDDCLDE